MGFFLGAFHHLLLFTKKYFSRRSFRTCRLRHEIHTIKTRPNNPLRFLQRKNSIRRYLANGLTCAAHKMTFKTQKRFQNKQYTPKSKDQPYESERTNFYVRFNKSNVAMHRPSILFLLPHQIATVQKTNNQINKPQNQSQKQPHQSTAKSITQTTTTINPRIRQTKTRPKQTTTNNPHSLDKKHPKTNTTSNYDKMQLF